MNQWKAIQTKKDAPWELYDLSSDLSEAHNIASQHTEILDHMKAFAVKEHQPVRIGTYTDRTRHERDRQAKYGFSGKNKR